jgi:hypothetical protein
MSNKLDPQDTRIVGILGGTVIPDVNTKTLNRYLLYLKEHLQSPCHLTGMEDFPWEEKYVFGYGSEDEYEELKKTKASYTDEFLLLKLEDDPSDFYGIMAKVRRLSDQKQFTLPLADLEATSEKSPNYELLDDYSVWFVNYR